MNEWMKLLVPLLLLAFWGLKQVLERETPPANRGAGPRPGGPRPPEGLAARERPRDAGLQWSGPPPRRPGPGSGPGIVVRGQPAGDDEIIILRPDSVLPQRLAGRQSLGRKPQRPSKPGLTPRGAEPSKPGPLGGQISQTVDQTLGLQSGMGPVDQRGAQHSSVRSQVSANPTPSPTADALSKALRSPERIREAFLLNELLQPPLALRKRRRV